VEVEEVEVVEVEKALAKILEQVVCGMWSNLYFTPFVPLYTF
jgi:hypothetical protein